MHLKMQKTANKQWKSIKTKMVVLMKQDEGHYAMQNVKIKFQFQNSHKKRLNLIQLIREDYSVDYNDEANNQLQHFNVGKKKDKKLKQHFYFFRRNKK